jgi:hypothetical protein
MTFQQLVLFRKARGKLTLPTLVTSLSLVADCRRLKLFWAKGGKVLSPLVFCVRGQIKISVSFVGDINRVERIATRNAELDPIFLLPNQKLTVISLFVLTLQWDHLPTHDRKQVGDCIITIKFARDKVSKWNTTCNMALVTLFMQQSSWLTRATPGLPHGT